MLDNDASVWLQKGSHVQQSGRLTCLPASWEIEGFHHHLKSSLGLSQHYGTERFKGDSPNSTPIMPRIISVCYTSLINSRGSLKKILPQKRLWEIEEFDHHLKPPPSRTITVLWYWGVQGKLFLESRSSDEDSFIQSDASSTQEDRWEKFCRRNDNFRRSLLGYPSKLTHFNTGILTRIEWTILIKIPAFKCVIFTGSQRPVSTCRSRIFFIEIHNYTWIRTQMNLLWISSQVWIVIIFSWLDWHKMEFRLGLNESLESVIILQIWFGLRKFRKDFPVIYTEGVDFFGIATTIRRATMWETDASGHHMFETKDPPDTPLHYGNI